MRIAYLKFLALGLCLVTLLAMVACGGQKTPPSDTDSTNTEGQTEAPKPEIRVEVAGESATVRSSEGLAYTVTGFSSVNGERFAFTEGLEIAFAKELTAEAFNRFSLTYSASAPLHVFVTYHDKRGKALTEDFYLEQGEC